MNNKHKTPLKLLLTFGFALLCALTFAQFRSSSAGPAQVSDGSKVYWSDKDDGRIWRSNLDGSEAETVPGFINRPEALALNILQNEMYFVVDEN